MKTKKFFNVCACAVTLFVAATLTSCVYDSDEAVAPGNEGNGNLIINLSTDRYQPTRATAITSDPTASVENTVNNIVVAIFDESTGKLKSIQNVDVTGVDAANGQITTEESVGVAADDVVLVAINIPLAKFAGLTVGTSEAADFRAIQLAYSDIINGTAVDEDNLPMMGDGTLSLAADARNFTTSITVHHLTAKIGLKSVKANFKTAREKFVPTKIYLLNVPEHVTMNYDNGTYTFPVLGDDYYQGGTDDATTYTWYSGTDDRMNYNEAFGTGATPLTAETLYGTKAWTQKYYFYCLPNNTAFDNTVAATANKDLRLVVEGTYTDVSGVDKTQYYPIVIDRLNGNTDDGVQPNKYYEIDLLIGGPGTENPYANPVNTYTTTANVVDVADFTLLASSASFASDGATYAAANAAVHTPEVGEYLYADGTWGRYPATTDIVGVIFSNAAYGTYKGLAVALKDAATATKWASTDGGTTVDNTDQPIANLTWTGLAKENQAGSYAVLSNLSADGNNGLTNYNLVKDVDNVLAAQAVKNFTGTLPSTENSGWFLPSIGEWLLMCKNLGGLDDTGYKTDDTTWGDDSGPWGVYYAGKANEVRVALNNYLKPFEDAGGTDGTDFDYFHGGTAASGLGNTGDASAVNYWSSSEWGGTRAFDMSFRSNGNLAFSRNSKSGEFRVRPVLAF